MFNRAFTQAANEIGLKRFYSLTEHMPLPDPQPIDDLIQGAFTRGDRYIP
jgi:hypothetical protein